MHTIYVYFFMSGNIGTLLLIWPGKCSNDCEKFKINIDSGLQHIQYFHDILPYQNIACIQNIESARGRAHIFLQPQKFTTFVIWLKSAWPGYVQHESSNWPAVQRDGQFCVPSYILGCKTKFSGSQIWAPSYKALQCTCSLINSFRHFRIKQQQQKKNKKEAHAP